MLQQVNSTVVCAVAEGKVDLCCRWIDKQAYSAVPFNFQNHGIWKSMNIVAIVNYVEKNLR